MTYTPGTVTPHVSEGGSVFAVFGQMIRATGGLTLAQICTVTGLESSTVQNWIKRGYVANPIKKRYYDRQFARILMISALREALLIEDVVTILKYLNGSVEDSEDDAISEPQLFDYFCEVTRELSPDSAISRDMIKEKILRVTQDFVGFHTDSRNKLHKALEIMCYAYQASLYKHEAELCMKLIQEG